jgi:hypothetical protein
MKRSGIWRIALLLLFLLVLSGCKKNPAAAPTTAHATALADSTRPPIGGFVASAGRVVPEQDLREFARLYLLDALTTVPRSLADMPGLRRDLPKAYPAFEDGRYVVFWGADPNRASDGASRTLLAYEKATPEKGGVVVFLDGHTANVTAQEFQTYAKPGVR